MSKNLNFNFNKHHDEVLEKIVDFPKDDEKVEKKYSETDSLLKVIYAIGADGYPVGDLAVFVGKKASPEVKKFILDNLMQDVSSAAQPSSMNLSDDEISVLTRQSYETSASYAQRLNSSIDKDKLIINAAKQSLSASKAYKSSSE